MKIVVILSLLMISTSSFSFSISDLIEFLGIDKVVYGNDDRYDSRYYHDERFLKASKSVAGMISIDDLDGDDNDKTMYKISGKKLV